MQSQLPYTVTWNIQMRDFLSEKQQILNTTLKGILSELKGTVHKF